MSNITVWTKQHENVLKELETSGRYIAKQEYIRMDLKEQDPVVRSDFYIGQTLKWLWGMQNRCGWRSR